MKKLKKQGGWAIDKIGKRRYDLCKYLHNLGPGTNTGTDKPACCGPLAWAVTPNFIPGKEESNEKIMLRNIRGTGI